MTLVGNKSRLMRAVLMVYIEVGYIESPDEK